MDYAADAYKFGALLIGLHGVGRLAGFNDLAAHVVPQAVAFLVLALLGVDAWLRSDGVARGRARCAAAEVATCEL